MLERKDVVDILTSTGVDVKKLDSGPKDSYQLAEELRNKEVTLAFKGGKLYRIAETVKVVVRIGDGPDQEFIRQTARIYPGGYHIVMNGFATISETRIRGEYLEETAIRGMREECGITVTPEQIRMPDANDCQNMEHLGIPEYWQRVDMHPSSVYWGLHTAANVYLFEVRLPHRPWQDQPHFILDGNVLIALRYWRPHEDVPEHLVEKLRALSL